MEGVSAVGFAAASALHPLETFEGGLVMLFQKSLEPASSFRRQPSLKWEIIEGRVALLDELEGELIRFNELGSRIWQELDGKRTLDQIILLLSTEFDVAMERLRRDAIRFVERLKQMEFIEPCEGH